MQPQQDDIIGAVCQVKWYKVWAYRLRSPNGGVDARPSPFIVIAIWTGFVLAENHGNTVTRVHFSRSIGIMYASILGSLSCLLMMNAGGSYFPSKTTFSASREWGRIAAAGTITVWPCVTRTTAVAKLG